MRQIFPILAIVLAFNLSTGVFAPISIVPMVQATPLEEGLDKIKANVNLPTDPGKNAREITIDILKFTLSFLALAAVIMIIVAGFFLVLGGGSEASAGKAKKIILYTVIGLVIIFFARVIVGFFTIELSSVI